MIMNDLDDALDLSDGVVYTYRIHIYGIRLVKLDGYTLNHMARLLVIRSACEE